MANSPIETYCDSVEDGLLRLAKQLVKVDRVTDTKRTEQPRIHLRMSLAVSSEEALRILGAKD